MTFLSMTVGVDASDEIAVHMYPSAGHSRPAVFLDVASGVSLLIHDAEVLDMLLGHARQARDWLQEATGQPPLPTDPDPGVDPVPVGDTGLTLHPLPVGVA